ncbi:MAG: N-acetylmuramoyl-L-alanine amidase, partial [Lachnospiraceae bacterium]|nr:N-acetylmuramoyl-L-alanine amidase [Lachnospiraceae bacterium]
MIKLHKCFIVTVCILMIMAGCGSKPDGVWPMAIMADGEIYFCYDEIIEAEEVEILGYITSTADMVQGPKVDNQANFPACLNQPYGMVDERMLLFYEDNWHVCYLTLEDENGDLEKLPYQIKVQSIEMERESRHSIRLSWSESYDDVVENYLVKRRDTVNGQGIGEWTLLATVPSDKTLSNGDWYYTDELDSEEPQQYEYRIDVEISDTENYVAEEGRTIFGSNVKICIDPGHYDIAREVADADEYRYVEGNFVLAVALELQDILKENYGIDSCLTRETGTITLGGYTDDELDSAHISLRGEYATKEDCDLFVSLHTNSNAEDANDYPTFFQPIEINKPIIIVNSAALTSEIALKAANATG